METIWKGTLARGGRLSKPFPAELVRVDGSLAIIERFGLNTIEVSPHEVSGQAWMEALAGAAQPK